MKIRKLFQKAAALLMAAVTAVSLVPATTAFAAGDIGTVAFQHTYDSDGNAMRYNSSAVINGHTAGGTGEYKYRMFIDGEVGLQGFRSGRKSGSLHLHTGLYCPFPHRF